MGTVIGYLLVVLLIASVVGSGIWLFTTRSYPIRQKTPPDLSAFQRDRDS